MKDKSASSLAAEVAPAFFEKTGFSHKCLYLYTFIQLRHRTWRIVRAKRRWAVSGYLLSGGMIQLQKQLKTRLPANSSPAKEIFIIKMQCGLRKSLITLRNWRRHSFIFLHYLPFSILIYSSCANFCTQAPTKIALLCECVRVALRERLLGTKRVGSGRYAATIAKEARTYIGQINCSRSAVHLSFAIMRSAYALICEVQTKQRHVEAHSGPFVICFFCFQVMSRRPLMRSNNIHAANVS